MHLLIKNKKHKLKSKLEYINQKSNKDLIWIKLKIYEKLYNMSSMFYKCSSLLYIKDFSEIDTKCVFDMNCLFYGYFSMQSLPDISNWKTDNIKKMNLMFSGCSSLMELCNIVKWKTKQVTDISGMLSSCTALEKIPDRSN